jgi:hypothetical protein
MHDEIFPAVCDILVLKVIFRITLCLITSLNDVFNDGCGTSINENT